MQQWYCLYTKPNIERHVAAALENRGLRVYLPLLRSRVTKSNVVEAPLFPCYLFLQIDLQETRLAAVRWTPGLRHVIGFGDHPTPLPNGFIELIDQRLTKMNSAGGLLTSQFKQGDRVRIKSGPLQDLEAIFDESTNASRRVQILLNILGQLNRVEIDANALEKLPEKPASRFVKQQRRTRGHGRPIQNS